MVGRLDSTEPFWFDLSVLTVSLWTYNGKNSRPVIPPEMLFICIF